RVDVLSGFSRTGQNVVPAFRRTYWGSSMSNSSRGSCRRVSPLVLGAKRSITAAENRITEKAPARRAGMPHPAPPARHATRFRTHDDSLISRRGVELQPERCDVRRLPD